MPGTETQSRPEVSFDEGFWPSVHRLDPSDSHRVIQALNIFSQNPDHPNLHLKQLRGQLSQLMSLRAGRDVRVLLVKRGETYVWLEAGNRRDVYQKAERGQFIVNPARRFMGFVDATVPNEERRQPIPASDRDSVVPTRGVFDHWSSPELVEAGFTSDEIDDLRSCVDEYDLLSLNWSEARINQAIELLELTPEQWRAGIIGGTESTLRRAIDEFGGLTGISPLFSAKELERIAAAPIEDWMIFLHPDQRSVVERRYDGPARVRGAAGTGKTVVALHRACHVARRWQDEEPGGRTLFTTVTESLPRVYEQLFRRLPDAPSDGVEFLSIDDLAYKVCRDAGVDIPPTDEALLDASFSRAYASVVCGETPLARAHLSADYLQTEVSRVIKGRGVETLDDYLTLVRTGRGFGLTSAARRQMWDLAASWDSECQKSGTIHPGDVLLAALHAARTSSEAWYRSVVVDEAQDLTMVGLQLLRALVNAGPRDRPDGLFLVGDGAQRVYPGGFTLRQAGVEVRGRTTVLRVNYRNTREILEAALAVAGDERVVDLDEEFRRGELAAATIRRGGRPVLACHRDELDEFAGLIERLRDVTASALVGTGDTAIFCVDEAISNRVMAWITDAGFPCQRLKDYDGTPSDSIKIGTYAEAKGLEFKAVFLPKLDAASSAGRDHSHEDELEERRILELSRLFVAMTRARDALVLSCVGSPPPLLSPALERLEVIER